MVDAGTLLFPKPNIPAGIQYEQYKITARGIARAYQTMGYDAVGIAEHDLAAGVEFLRDLTGQTAFPWLSANLVGRDGKPLFRPYAILKKGKTTVGIIGLTGMNAEKIVRRNGMKILPWQETLTDVLDDLRKKCDLIILLSNLRENQNLEISNKHPEIQIIIQSGNKAVNLRPRLHNNTLTMQTTREGKYLGEMKITWRSSGEWYRAIPGSLLNKKRELDRLNRQLNTMLKKGDPGKVYKNRPSMLRRIKHLRNRTKKLTNDIELIKDNEGRKGEKSEWKNIFQDLSHRIKDDEEVAAIVNMIKDQKAKLTQKIQHPRNLPGYKGSTFCRQCHPRIYQVWRSTLHAGALHSLKEKKGNYNIKCLPCHVTGLSEDQGTRALSLPSALWGVGCESCHGPGREHGENPGTGNITRNTERKICLNCHKPEHDDSFDFEKDRLSVH